MNSWIHDDCCAPHLSAASLAGQLDSISEWDCPECGCRWHVQLVGESVRYWTPQPKVEIF